MTPLKRPCWRRSRGTPRRHWPRWTGAAARSSNMPIGRHASPPRSEEHTSELQSLMRISYAVFCLQTKQHLHTDYPHIHLHNNYTLSIVTQILLHTLLVHNPHHTL